MVNKHSNTHIVRPIVEIVKTIMPFFHAGQLYGLWGSLSQSRTSCDTWPFSASLVLLLSLLTNWSSGFTTNVLSSAWISEEEPFRTPAGETMSPIFVSHRADWCRRGYRVSWASCRRTCPFLQPPGWFAKQVVEPRFLSSSSPFLFCFFAFFCNNLCYTVLLMSLSEWVEWRSFSSKDACGPYHQNQGLTQEMGHTLYKSNHTRPALCFLLHPFIANHILWHNKRRPNGAKPKINGDGPGPKKWKIYDYWTRKLPR